MSGLQTWRTRHGDTVEVYRAEDGYRYRVKARNGEIVEQGSEPYTTVYAAAEAAARHHPVIDDLTTDEDVAAAEDLIEHTTDDDAVTVEDLVEHTPAATEVDVTECPDCGKTGRYDGRVLVRGRGIYTCPEGHRWQDLDEAPTTKGIPL